MRKGKFINTYSEVKFWPLDPRKEEVKSIDIAHSLSMMCRANGHYKHFYSVAQHAINCYYEAKQKEESKRVRVACLLHDASEAYISDITRPVKCLLPEYLKIEEVLQEFIYGVFGIENITPEEQRKIDYIDDAMLSYEMEHLLNNPGVNDLQVQREYDLSFKNMNEVRDEFIRLLESETK